VFLIAFSKFANLLDSNSYLSLTPSDIRSVLRSRLLIRLSCSPNTSDDTAFTFSFNSADMSNTSALLMKL